MTDEEYKIKEKEIAEKAKYFINHAIELIYEKVMILCGDTCCNDILYITYNQNNGQFFISNQYAQKENYKAEIYSDRYLFNIKEVYDILYNFLKTKAMKKKEIEKTRDDHINNNLEFFKKL